MFSAFTPIATWFVFWLITAVTIKLDDKRAKAKAAAAGTQDFADRRIRSYVLAAFLLGGLVLVLYFWATRRSKKGGLIGAGALAGVVVLTFIVSSIYSVAATTLDYTAGVRACATLSPADPDGDKCTGAAYHFLDKRDEFLKAGCAAGEVGPCLILDEQNFVFGSIGNSAPPPESEVRKKAREICESRPPTAHRGRCAVFDVK